MKRILTKPKLIDKNTRVYYTGNHYIAMPEINGINGSIKSLNVISLKNKGLVEISGQEALFTPSFSREGKPLKIKRVIVKTENYFIPSYHFTLEEGAIAKVKIYADLKEKGFIYQFETSEKIEVQLECQLDQLSLLRFNSHPQPLKKEIFTDKWLSNPVMSISTNGYSFALAFGCEQEMTFTSLDGNLMLSTTCENSNCFYIALNSDPDGASTTLIHLKRKIYKNIYREFNTWLQKKAFSYPEDPAIERRLNQNLFFNYFFAVGKDLDSDSYIALTSRSPRYYVSGAFWERDSFLWSFPAISLVDKELYLKLNREMIIRHGINPGDHAHYIDGTVLYPGFELDEAASYFVSLEAFEKVDPEMQQALEGVLQRIEEEYDEKTGLYKTFLLPSDDPSEYPLVTIDNVILWHGLKNLRSLYEKQGEDQKVEFLKARIEGIYKGIYEHLVKEVDGKKVFLWSADAEGNYRLYNDPPGNLGLMPYYGFVNYKDELFKNTIDYYYSPKYKYYFEDAKIKELACDHHPDTPSGLGLCGSLLNPLLTQQALEWLKNSKMDYGLLSESFDRNTGEAKTGIGFATGSGYLAFVLHHLFIKNQEG